MASVAEKAQQEPHWPWSLIGVTTPSTFLQSTEVVEVAPAEVEVDTLEIWRLTQLLMVAKLI